MWRVLLMLSFMAYASGALASNGNSDSWPDVSFVVLEENPKEFIFERDIDIVATLNKVVLIPIIANYHYGDNTFSTAIADPFVIEPGKDTLKAIFSKYQNHNQKVKRCIVLAKGYCPGTLQPVINYAGIYKGKEVWMIELAKIDDETYKKVYESIIQELNQRNMNINKQMTFEQALNENRLLSTNELLSPVLRYNDGFRRVIVLWNVNSGTEISICISEKGMNIIKEHLHPAE